MRYGLVHANRCAGEAALLGVVRFGEDFKARPALEAAHVRIALDLDPPDFHRIFAGWAERRIGTQRVVVFHDGADFRKQTPTPTIWSRSRLLQLRQLRMLRRRSELLQRPRGGGGYRASSISAVVWVPALLRGLVVRLHGEAPHNLVLRAAGRSCADGGHTTPR
jgi:hypothetical protein